MWALVSGGEVVDAENRDDVVEALQPGGPIHAGSLEQLDLGQSRCVLTGNFQQHSRRLIHGCDPSVGRALENRPELEARAAADVENPDGFVGRRNPSRRFAVQVRAVVSEFGVPQVGNAVEEVGQALDVETDAAGIPGHPARHAKAFELPLERLAIVFERHTFSIPRQSGADFVQ